MANVLGGINLAQIAEETLDTLVLEFNNFKFFTRDFSDAIKDRGESVTTRLPSARTAADLSGGYTAVDATTTAKTVTLNKFYGNVLGFTDAEVSKAGDIEWLRRMFIAPAVESVIEQVMDDLLALVLIANFSGALTASTAANFDADDVADAATACSVANIPKRGRYFLMGAAYYGALTKDNAIQAVYASGSDGALRENVTGRLHGFEILPYNDVPANAQNLVGFCGSPDGLIMAARTIADPAAPHVEVVNVTDPTSGLPLQFRRWYDADSGVAKMSVGLLYGVAVGNGSALLRLPSA